MTQTEKDDIWGSLLNEVPKKNKVFGEDDYHVLIVGGEKSGKTSLMSSFFGKQEDTVQTLGFLYQSVSFSASNKEKLLHFWELGGGIKMESLLDTIILPETQNLFSIMVCMNLSKSSSILEGLDWLSIIDNRFGKNRKSVFIVGTYYDIFEGKSPNDREIIVQGLRIIASQHNYGIFFFSPKIDTLPNRFKGIIKSVAISKGNLKEKSIDYMSPVIIGPGQDTEINSGNEVVSEMINRLHDDAANEKREKTPTSSRNPGNDPVFEEEEIDALVFAKRQSLKQGI